jgi:predicted RNA-binding Zn ribbon-like protein
MFAGEIDPPSRPAVQPGGRSPAPGELALVQSFVNTHYDLQIEHGAELLATPSALADWLRRRELITEGAARLTGRELRRALSVRESLRSLVRANFETSHDDLGAALAALNDAAAGGAVEIRFTAERPRFVLAERGGLDAALGVLLAITAGAILDGSFSRLKICPGAHCGWAFYDHSRNRSGRWCSMSVCGGRAKARAHYLRHRGEVA